MSYALSACTASSTVLGASLEHALEATESVHRKEAGFWRLDGEGVRDTSRERNEPTRAPVIVFASDVEHHFAAPLLAIWPVQLVPPMV
jgi:hypothetical protein